MPAGAWERGLEHFSHERYLEASRAFRRATVEHPTQEAAWRDLGITLGLLGNITEAEDALFTAVALGPRDARAWFYLGTLRARRGDHAGAVQALEKATEADPEEPTGWEKLASSLQALGREGEAEVAWGHAHAVTGPEPPERHPVPASPSLPYPPRRTVEEARSWISLARRLLTLEKKEEALSAYRQAELLDAAVAHRSGFMTLLAHLETKGDVVSPIRFEAVTPPVSGQKKRAASRPDVPRTPSDLYD